MTSGSRRTWEKIVDPRLWRHGRAFRRWAIGTVVVGVALTVCLIGQATFLAAALTALMHHRTRVGAIRDDLIDLVAATAARGALSFLSEWTATRAAIQTKAELREAALARALALGPVWLAAQRTGDLAVMLGHGIDGLDEYIGRYLPATVLAVLAPVVLLGWIAHLDLLSAGILVVTLALLPVFMVLLGRLTRARMATRWRTLTRLSGQFLDAVEGLATLRAFGRAHRQREVIAETTGDLRRATLGTLQVAFLSALVLETLAAVGTALVAVPLGLRLLSGTMTLAPALTILILTPEVFLPLRRASSNFHASTQGLAALEATFALIDLPDVRPHDGTSPGGEGSAGGGVPRLGRRPVPTPALTSSSAAGPPAAPAAAAPDGDALATAALRPPTVELQAVSVSYPGRSEPALARCTVAVARGEHVGVTGASGAGKSTLLSVVAGLLTPSGGRLLVDGDDLEPTGTSLDAWRRRLTWVPQRPTLFSGTVADNLRLGAPDASDDELWTALSTARLADLVSELRGGLQARLREHAEDLSAGERQRLALARALVRAQAGLVLLDEPTAHLDPDTESEVVEGLHDALRGRTAFIVTHRPRLLELTDRVVVVEGGVVDPAANHAGSVLGVARRPAATGVTG